MYNEKNRKIAFEWSNKREGLFKKYGIKSLGSWTVHGEHLDVAIFEVPSIEVFQKFMMEPEIIALGSFETIETKIVISEEEVAKMLRQIK